MPLKILESKFLKRALGQAHCDQIRTWFQHEGLDTNAVDSLEQEFDSEICDLPMDLYDAREDGGFVALAGLEGGLHCIEARIIVVFGKETFRGVSMGGQCWAHNFGVLRQDGVAYPVILENRTQGADFSYHLDLRVPRNAARDCALTVTYRPEPRVEHWFGPKGENDVDPALRRIVEPILLERAVGRDAASLIAPLLDRPSGSVAYDRLNEDYPQTEPEIARGDPRAWIPFTDEEHRNYPDLQGDVTPLLIDGRHFSLTFGTPIFGWRPLPSFGFALYEWDGKDFQPIAGGFMAKRGVDPKIN